MKKNKSLSSDPPTRKPKILFIYPYFSSFIKNDFELLRLHFDVKSIQWTRTKDMKNMLCIIWNIYKNDLIFIWFAGGYASRVIFFSKLFGKKSIVVVGGYEVANLPEIDYGALTNAKSARKVKYVLENANKIIAVSEFTKKEILAYVNSVNPRVIYNGVDTDKFCSKEIKEDLIITIGSKIKLKGLDIFIETAKLMLETKFMIIGLSDDKQNQLKTSKPMNMELVGFVSHEDINQYYRKAKVYCQLSYRESFGMALAEAMACECVPVVTDNAAMLEVVGETGFYVPYGNPKATAEAIRKALKYDNGKPARERIIRTFSLKIRENELLKIICDVMTYRNH